MSPRSRERKKPNRCPVTLAVAAVVDSNPSPLDLDVRDLDPSPASLDLPAREETSMCPHHRRSRPPLDACIICGQPPSEDCVAEDEG